MIPKQCIALIEGETEFSPIGVGYKSKTKKLFAKEVISTKTQEKFHICDSPGFLDD